MDALRRMHGRGWVAAVALFAVLLGVLGHVETAIGVAACRERAEFELILCAESPGAWVLPALLAGVVALSVVLGAELQRALR